MNILYLLIIIPVAIIVLSIIFMMRPNSMGKTMEKMMERQAKTIGNVMDKNEDLLKKISTKGADISSEGIETAARAIKRGMSEDKDRESKFCKHCGKSIDSDSKFCNYCGKEQ